MFVWPMIYHRDSWTRQHVLGEENFDLACRSRERSSKVYSCLYPMSKVMVLYQLPVNEVLGDENECGGWWFNDQLKEQEPWHQNDPCVERVAQCCAVYLQQLPEEIDVLEYMMTVHIVGRMLFNFTGYGAKDLGTSLGECLWVQWIAVKVEHEKDILKSEFGGWGEEKVEGIMMEYLKSFQLSYWSCTDLSIHHPHQTFIILCGDHNTSHAHYPNKGMLPPPIIQKMIGKESRLSIL